MFKWLLVANLLLASAFASALCWAVMVWAPPLGKPVRVDQAFRVPAATPVQSHSQSQWFAQVL